MTLTTEQQELIADFAEQYEVTLVTDYSGRGMYGKTCIGFITNSPNQFQLGFNLCLFIMEQFENINSPYDMMLNELLDELASCDTNIDSMGRDSIVYFPYINV